MHTNKVLLVGYVGRDLKTQILSNGSKRVAIRVATHYKKKQACGTDTWNTVWHNVIAWDLKAEFAARSFVQGSKIMVEGFLDYKVYTQPTGQRQYFSYVRATGLINLDR
jgi:single-strand DNA-binding protein